MHFRHHFNSETLMSVRFRVNAYRFGQPTSTLRKDLGRGTLIPARDVLGVAFAQTSTMPERDRLKRPTEEEAVDVLRLCKGEPFRHFHRHPPWPRLHQAERSGVARDG